MLAWDGPRLRAVRSTVARPCSGLCFSVRLCAIIAGLFLRFFEAFLKLFFSVAPSRCQSRVFRWTVSVEEPESSGIGGKHLPEGCVAQDKPAMSNETNKIQDKGKRPVDLKSLLYYIVS